MLRRSPEGPDMAIYWTENRPDMHTERRAWEKSWEDDFERNYRMFAQLPCSILVVIPKKVVQSANTDSNLLALEQLERALCELQQRLAHEAAIECANLDFESRWRALSAEKREEVVLEGIYRTMRVAGNESRRQWCPDSTLSHLASQDGEEYLRMLRCLVPDNLDARIVEPIQIPHAIVDRMFTPSATEAQSPGCRTMLRTFRTSRMYILTHVIWFTMHAFAGRNMEVSLVKTPISAAQRKVDARILPRSYVKQHQEDRKNLDYICQCCGREVQKLQACGNCRKIGRKILYCSKECQIKDWKSGVPRPHKLICGKELQEEDMELLSTLSSPDTSQSLLWLPKADPGFKRSLALLHQISLLSEGYGDDYIIVNPYPATENNPITFSLESNAFDKIAFLVQRNRAFKSGSPEAVNTMFSLLAPVLDRMHLPRANLCKQLGLEFGVDIPATAPFVDVAEAAASATHDEVQFIADALVAAAGGGTVMANGRACTADALAAHWRGAARHKALDSRAARCESMAAAAPWLPRRDPGYVWSPALMDQVFILAEPDEHDYLVLTEYPRHDSGLAISYGSEEAEVMDRWSFLIARNRALKTGNAAAVNVMYAVHAPYLRKIDAELGVPDAPAAFARQLAMEYGVQVDTALSAAEAQTRSGEPTEEEVRFMFEGLKSAEAEYRRRHGRDPEE